MPRFPISALAASLLLASGAILFERLGEAWPATASSQAKVTGASQTGVHLDPPSSAELKTRTLKVIANQHSDDNALDQFERIERVYDRTAGQSPKVLEDKTYRVVPIVAGSYRMLVKENDKPVDAAEYNRELQQWATALELALRPDDPRMKSAMEKYQKRQRDRAELVDSTNSAYLEKWLGGEMMNGHLCDVVELDPNPQFHPHSILQDALTHAVVKVWVDHASDQIVRGEAHLTRDISVGGGVLGKLYRGGVFSLEQTEVSPGIWLPVRRQYDYMGRKFLFPFEEHQLIEDTHYLLLGSPNRILTDVRNEIASRKPAPANP
jgi:hypothetical protein